MEDVMNLRSGTVRGLVLSIDDTGEAQRAVVQTRDGSKHNVEVFQLDGMAAVPSGDGAIALMFAVENDPSQYAALIANPSTRFGKQAPGERTVSAPDGTRIAVRQGGTVEVWAGNGITTNSLTLIVNAATSVTVVSPAVTFQAPTGDTEITINGTLTVTKDIIDRNGAHGSLNTLRSDYDDHTHLDSLHGTTSTPTPMA